MAHQQVRCERLRNELHSARAALQELGAASEAKDASLAQAEAEKQECRRQAWMLHQNLKAKETDQENLIKLWADTCSKCAPPARCVLRCHVFSPRFPDPRASWHLRSCMRQPLPRITARACLGMCCNRVHICARRHLQGHHFLCCAKHSACAALGPG